MDGTTLARSKVAVIFGTRPEAIKLWPVIRALEALDGGPGVVTVSTAQHEELLRPLTRILGLEVDHDLRVMSRDQTPNQVCARILERLEPVLARERPDLVLVQGDTTSALAGALAAFHARIPVGHVEAGLRTGNPGSPFPEELNRRLISQLAGAHFAPTPGNRDNLLAEGVPRESVFVTGNPVIDAVREIASRAAVPEVAEILERTRGRRRVLLTAHRRENDGRLAACLGALREFVEEREDVELLFPVHPRPAVREAARRALAGCPAIQLLPPLEYPGFIQLMQRCWLVVSDSGGVQEEAPALGVPLLILRDETERAEVLETGLAQLVGCDPERLLKELRNAHSSEIGGRSGGCVSPFGCGDSSARIARILAERLRRAA